METRTTSSAAVSEVLNVDNYLVWSVQVKTYLIAQDLWDIVEATVKCPEQEDDDIVEATDESPEQEDDDIIEVTDESPEQEDDDIVEATDECPKQEDDEAASKDWSKKNAMALHVIQISCPQRICHVISLINSAKIAWKTLESICSIPKSDYFGMSLSILHVRKHFIPQIGLRSRRYDNKLTQKKKLERNEMKYRIIMLFLLPSISFVCHHHYNLNNTPVVLIEAKATFEQREWPYAKGHVMGAKSMIESIQQRPILILPQKRPIPMAILFRYK